MKITNIHETKTNLSKLIEYVLQGNELVIAKAGKPVVKLIAYKEKQLPRKPGGLKGKIKISHDFDKMPLNLLKPWLNPNL
jgi:prevent-host-death family protein